MTYALARRSRRLFCTLVLYFLALPLGQTVFQRNLQFLDRGMREDYAVILQQVIGMNLIARNQFQPLDISRTALQVLIARVGYVHNQNCLIHLQRIERRAELLGLRVLHIKCVDDDQLAVGVLRRQGRTQRAQKLLARESVVVRTRDRAMYGRAVPPQWRTDRANAGAPRALLLPQLLARTGYLPAGLGGVGAAVLSGAVMLYRLPDQIFVDRAEDFVGEVEGSDLLAAQIVYVDSCHIASHVARTPSSATLSPAVRNAGEGARATLTPSSPLSLPPSTDRPWPNPQIRGALWAAFWPS